MAEQDYNLDMEIQPDELDLEWLDQPKLMVKYTMKLADARMRKDLAKEEVDLIKATLDRKIREKPDRYHLEKITEAVVAATILTLDDYKDVMKKLIRANHEVNILSGVVSAVEQRKQALENMVRLFGQSYFAGPSIPRNLMEERELQQKDSDRRVGKTFKRTKK